MTESPRFKSAVIAVLALSLGWALLVHPTYAFDLNSDALYIDDLWRSFFDGRGFRAWILPPGPSLFPDLPLYALSTLVGPDLGLRHTLYAFWVAALLYGALASCMRRWLGMGALDSALAALAGLALYVALLSPESGLGDIFRPSHHGGTLVVALWALALAPGEGEEPGPLALLLWTLTVAAAEFSDPMFLGWAVLPLLGFCRARGRMNPAWILSLAAGLLASRLAMDWMRHSGGPMVSVLQWGYFRAHRGAVMAEGVRGMAYVAEHAPALGALALLWLAWIGRRLSPALAWFSLLAALSTLAPLLFTGKIAGRHLLPLYFIPAAFLPAFVWSRAGAWLAPFSLALALSLAWSCAQAESPELKAPYPEALAQLEGGLERPGAMAGWADYWSARRLRLLSRRGLWLDPVGTELAGDLGLARYPFISNTRLPALKHSLVLMDKLDPAGVIKAFGKPRAVKRYGGMEVWFYPEDKDLALR